MIDSFLYSVILTEYVAIEPRVYVRVSVCASVCASVRLCVCASVCLSSTAQTDEPILMKLSINDL